MKKKKTHDCMTCIRNHLFNILIFYFPTGVVEHLLNRFVHILIFFYAPFPFFTFIIYKEVV